MNEHPGSPKQFGSRLSEETVEENRELLAKIGSDSILKAPAIKEAYTSISIFAAMARKAKRN